MVDEKPVPRQDARALAWFARLIEEYRKRARSEDAPVRRLVHVSQRLGRPTQFAHLWMRSWPDTEFHFVVAMHWPSLSDGVTYSWGPFEPKDLQRVLEELYAEPWFQWPVKLKRRGPVFSVRDPTSRGRLSDHLARQIGSIFDTLRVHLMNPSREDSALYLQGWDANHGSVVFHGYLLQRNPADFVDQFFREARGNRERRRHYLREVRQTIPTPPVPYVEPPPSGYASRLYPPCNIGKHPASTMAELLWGPFTSGSPGTRIVEVKTPLGAAFAT